MMSTGALYSSFIIVHVDILLESDIQLLHETTGTGVWFLLVLGIEDLRMKYYFKLNSI